MAGYYALAADSVASADVDPWQREGGDRYHQPVVILTRLGVDRAAHDAGLGRASMVDALRRVAAAPRPSAYGSSSIARPKPRVTLPGLATFETGPADPM
ncbi:hypothetical protein [Rhizomonospora bruguierae]|uniref:hypothetical protein n=1 Tax=Rhizomonospora bruguierae TaxID=1581705 RepID=UPI001BCE442B|nr:hypothetical protein [Micromonospora sp. NBRC 107566]